MSFASDARSEISHTSCDQECCAKSEINAAIVSAGNLSLALGGVWLTLAASEATTIRRYFTILKKFFDISAEMRVVKADRLNGAARYQLIITTEDLKRLLKLAGIGDVDALFDDGRELPEDLFRYSCCKIAFLRTAFLFCGTITNPEKAYHIEFASLSEQLAQTIIKLLSYFEIPAKIACRKSKYVVYLKSGDDMSSLLSLLGAHTSVLNLENIRITKDLYNQVNRQMNCDSSNIDRVMKSAERQIKDIEFIDSEMGLDKLPRQLRAIAEARLKNPEMSLTALGESLMPEIGKSGVNSRLRKLADIADKLRSGEDIDL